MARGLTRIATRIFDTPLMIQKQKLEVILQVLGPRLNQIEALEEFEDRDGSRPVALEQPERIAVIQIHGTLVQRGSWLDAMSGLMSYEAIRMQLREALDDRGVAGIVLDVDSPGGEVSGVFDLAQEIYEARELKPIYAIANEQAFSAAYLLASAAGKIFVPRTGGLGSIGVIATHIDQSKADEQAGLTYTHIYAGEKKADLTSHKPLSDRAAGDLQAEVDRVYDLFVDAVSTYRDMAPADVRGTEAGLFFGKSAVKAELADEVSSQAEAIASIVEEVSMRTRQSDQRAAAAADPVSTAAAAVATASGAASAADQVAAEIENRDQVHLETGAADEAAADEATTEGTDTAEADDAAAEEAGAGEPEPVDQAAVQAAVAAERQRCAEILADCAAIGQLEMASTLVLAGLSREQAKARLFSDLSASPETLNALGSEGSQMDAGETLMARAARGELQQPGW